MYLESGTVVLSPPRTLENPASTDSLITTGEVMAQSLMGIQSHRSVRYMGGTATFGIALVNGSDEEYPSYRYPFATLTSESTNPESVRRTFADALQVLKKIADKQQDQIGVSSRSHFSISVIGATGPMNQSGSLKRSYAALALLAILVACMISTLLDRHRARLMTILPWHRSVTFPPGFNDATRGTLNQSSLNEHRVVNRRLHSRRRASRHRR